MFHDFTFAWSQSLKAAIQFADFRAVLALDTIVLDRYLLGPRQWMETRSARQQQLRHVLSKIVY
jgi:hypothetical protein